VPASDTTVVAGLRDDVDATAALVLSVDLCNGDIWVTGPDADPVTAARVRHHVHRSDEPDPFIGGFLIGRQGATTAEREFGPAGWAASALHDFCRDALGVDQLLGVPMGRTEKTVHLLLLGRDGPDFPDEALDRMDRAAEPPTNRPADSPRIPTPVTTSSVSRAGLTPREREVLTALETGRTAYAISALIGCSERTVHRHLQSIYRKLGTHDRRVTVRRARELHLI
jgi:DNA-binding CsgD family transcriptional regulator